jgi:hypothetical protein
MTDAERQARHRAARAAGALVIRIRRPPDHRGRARRWHDAVAQPMELQAHYTVWLEALPVNLQDGATADALRAVCDLDLTELQAVDPPARIWQGLTSPVSFDASHRQGKAIPLRHTFRFRRNRPEWSASQVATCTNPATTKLVIAKAYHCF